MRVLWFSQAQDAPRSVWRCARFFRGTNRENLEIGSDRNIPFGGWRPVVDFTSGAEGEDASGGEPLPIDYSLSKASAPSSGKCIVASPDRQL